MSASRTVGLLLLLLAPSIGGCVAHVRSQCREVSYAPTSTASDAERRAAEIRSIEAQLGREGRPDAELRRALALLDELEALEGESTELTLERMRVLFYLVEPIPDEEEDEVIELCQRGEALAERIRRGSPERVEGHYYGALFLGLRARHQPLRAAFWMGQLEELGRRAIELDATFDDAGPLRFLGMFLISAPSFPYGPGDPDGGVELLEQANERSEYPLNRVLLARALVEVDDEERACEALNEAFAAPSEGRWALTRERWSRDAEQLAAQISCEVSTTPAVAAIPSAPSAP